jgi:hypothetical protein
MRCIYEENRIFDFSDTSYFINNLCLDIILSTYTRLGFSIDEDKRLFADGYTPYNIISSWSYNL